MISSWLSAGREDPPGQVEHQRVMVLSVPYAMKAADAFRKKMLPALIEFGFRFRIRG